MARHYSTKDFFRQMPNGLLARYFSGQEACGTLDFSPSAKAKPGEQFGAWPYVAEPQRNAMEAEFRDIFELSCEKGFRAIMDEAAWHLQDDPAACSAFVDILAAPANSRRPAVGMFA